MKHGEWNRGTAPCSRCGDPAAPVYRHGWVWFYALHVNPADLEPCLAVGDLTDKGAFITREGMDA